MNSTTHRLSWLRFPSFNNESSFYRQWSVKAGDDEGRKGDSVVFSSGAVDSLTPTAELPKVSGRSRYLTPDNYRDVVYA